MGVVSTNVFPTLQQDVAAWLDAVDAIDGLDTRQLRAGDVLTVQTQHSVYTLDIVDPQHGDAKARGSGDFLQDQVTVRVLGTTLTGRGSLLKTGVIAPGFKMVLQVPDGELMTSRVRRVFINGMPFDGAGRSH